MLVAASWLARDLRRAVIAPNWLVGDGEQNADLLAILRAARRPYDEQREEEAAARRREDAERDRLRSDPEALANRLRHELPRGWGREQLGGTTTTALLLSVEDGGDLDAVERAAFGVVAEMLDEPLYVRLAEREPTDSERHSRSARLAASSDPAPAPR